MTKFPATDAFHTYSAPDWIRRGAIREDDDFTAPSIFQGNDSPLPQEVRVLHHFYDPVNNKPLNGSLPPTLAPYLLNQTPQKATDWALGATDALASPPVVNPNRGNHFSLADAREAEWRALTLSSFDPNNPSTPTPLSNPTFPKVSTKPLMRKAYWATMFRSLGDAIHLLQDMAQPQHTRNDSHMGSWYGPLLGAGHKSIYEQYIEARARGGVFTPADPTYGEKGMTRPILPYKLTTTPLTYTGYLAPVFPDFTSFYTTATSAPMVGNGMADYSNRGFFTVGTNANASSNNYAWPTTNFTKIAPISVGWTDPNSAMYTDLSTLNEYVYYGNVYDSYAGSIANVTLTSEGALNEWLEPLPNHMGGYTLTRQNYDDMASLLIPRAVGYSAGLLNHFFMGSMTIAAPPSGVYALMDESTAFTNGNTTPGFNKLQLVLTNTTQPDGPYQKNMTNGVVVAVIKYHKNTCFKPDLSGEIGAGNNSVANCRASNDTIVNGTESPGSFDVDNSDEDIVVSKTQSLSLTSGANTTLIFDFSANPIPLGASDFYLQVVYRGGLGDGSPGATDKDAIVVATQNISEPTYYTMFNHTDYYWSHGGFTKLQPGTGGVNDYVFSDGFTFQINGLDAFSINSFPMANYITLALLVDPPTQQPIPFAGPFQITIKPIPNPKLAIDRGSACSNYLKNMQFNWTFGVRNKFLSPQQTPETTSTIRGIQTYDSYNCTFSADQTSPPLVYTDQNIYLVNEMAPLPSGTKPLPITINSGNFPQ